MKPTLSIPVLLVIAAWFVGGGAAPAQQRERDAAQKQPDPKPARAKPAPGMTKAREAAALAFVREHHPELEQLLIQLKESQPKQYEQAVRDLFRTSERLATFHERDPPRHNLELKAWQAKSRVQLLSATLLMTPRDKQLRTKLKQLLLDEAKVRRELLKLEQNRVQRRLEKIEAQINDIDANAERTAERQVKLLLERPGKSKKTQDATKASAPGID